MVLPTSITKRQESDSKPGGPTCDLEQQEATSITKRQEARAEKSLLEQEEANGTGSTGNGSKEIKKHKKNRCCAVQNRLGLRAYSTWPKSGWPNDLAGSFRPGRLQLRAGLAGPRLGFLFF
jgi:hypothetical protein